MMTSIRVVGIGGVHMDELVVKRWRKGGKDRLYVNRPGVRGEPVAWYDCVTGKVEVLVTELGDAASAKIQEWLRAEKLPPPRQPAEAPAPAHSRAAAVPTLPPLTPEDDLARNRPGDALRQMAREKEREHSRLVRLASRLTRGTLVPEPIRHGLEGEAVVGAALERLASAGWRILHGIKWPSGSDIDHVAIGPPGVFTVNAKHHVGASVWVGEVMLRVGGNSTDYLRNSLSEAERTARLLSRWCGRDVPVRPVIGVVGARSLKLEVRESRVLVVDGATIDQALASAPTVLSPGQITSVYTVARHSKVWLSADRSKRSR
ncbi:nuclease-related domain-containing protein [Streptomyces sp. NPDC053427]|uniref:nuclease-related domain-containing protein n=1 Tax=Streptomyces sp. NPDC053427 TaxID=3365701 RepID=UPI0037D37737